MSNWIKVLLSAAFPFFAFLTIEMLSTGPEAWGNYPIFSKSLFVATLFYMYVIMPAVSFFWVKMTPFDKKNAEYAFFWIFIVAFASVFLTMLTFSTRLLCAAWMFFYPYFIFHFLCFIYDTSPAFFQNVRFIYLVTSSSRGYMSTWGVPNRGIYSSSEHLYVNGVRYY